MKAVSAYAELLKFDPPVFRTIDLAARLGISASTASQVLCRLAREQLVLSVFKGCWTLPSLKDPFLLAEYLTAPAPAYVSLQSALSYHGVISQLPHIVYVVSLGRTREIKTSFGTFSIHHVGPDFFLGYEMHGAHCIKIASTEKALLDICYLQQNHPKLFRALPELELPKRFDSRFCKRMIGQIKSLQRRRAVERRMASIVNSQTLSRNKGNDTGLHCDH